MNDNQEGEVTADNQVINLFMKALYESMLFSCGVE